MGSTNHIQTIPNNSDIPSPSSAFDTDPVTDMEITLVNTPPDNSDNDNGRLPDVVVEAEMCDDERIEETYFSIAIQVFIPFLVAGFGMVFAGLVLDKIQVLLKIYLNLIQNNWNILIV